MSSVLRKHAVPNFQSDPRATEPFLEALRTASRVKRGWRDAVLKPQRGIFSVRGREVKALPALASFPEASCQEERRRYSAY